MAEKDHLLSGKRLIDLASKLRPGDLMLLALNLGFETPEVEHIQARHPLDSKMQIYDMLWTWKQKQEGGDSVAVDVLCKALEDIGRTDLSLDLKPKVGESFETISTPQEPQWEKLASILGFSQSKIADYKRLRPAEPQEQTWQMLMDWRGQQPSHEARTAKLCNALETIGRKDLAHEIQGLCDVRLHMMSKELGPEWEDLAFHLRLKKSEIRQIKQNHPDRMEQVFDMLDQWRERQSTNEDGKEVLCRALEEVNRRHLAVELRKNKHSLMAGLKRLWKLAYMLTLEPGSKESVSEIYHPPTHLIINNQEDLRSLSSELKNADKPLELKILDVHCRSVEELGLQRKILHSKNIIVSERLELQCTLSEKWKEELQCLEETLLFETKFPRILLTLFGDADDDTGYDMEYVGRYISNISNKLQSDFGIAMHDMIRSGSDVDILAHALKDCKLYLFGCRTAKLHGHVGHLAPLITSSLQHLFLTLCNLDDDDIPDLVSILPEGHGLYSLDVSSNMFTVAMLDCDLTAHLKKLPKLNRLDVNDVGSDAELVKPAVLRNLPQMTEIEVGVFQT